MDFSFGSGSDWSGFGFTDVPISPDPRTGGGGPSYGSSSGFDWSKLLDFGIKGLGTWAQYDLQKRQIAAGQYPYRSLDGGTASVPAGGIGGLSSGTLLLILAAVVAVALIK